MSVTANNIEFRIDGKTFEDYKFTKIRLVQELQQPSELHFTMRKETFFEDNKDIRLSLSKELLGKEVVYSFETLNNDRPGEVHYDIQSFAGIIFNINVLRDNKRAEMAIEVVAYSPDYLLQDTPHCYSYENETLQSIVLQTLNPYEIPIQNSPRMGQAIPYIVQYNESNYAFLKRLALRFGEWLYYDGEKLVFGEINKSECIELSLEHDILNYQYLLNMEHLNFSHAHHNYLDYANPKTEVSTFIDDEELHPMTDIVYDSSHALYKKETFAHLQVSSPEGSFDETELSIKAQGFGQKDRLMKCVGTSRRADLRIGSVIQLKEYYEGKGYKREKYEHDKLLVCGIVHTVNKGIYHNQFTAIPADCEYPPYAYTDCSPKANTQRAVVKDNRDPEKLGRVRVQFLWQQEQDANLMTPWIRIAQPHGGGDKGFYFIPEIDEEVIVGFENSNAEKPYVIGTLYHGKHRPDGKEWVNDNNDVKAIRTKNGHTIEFHDKGKGGYIKIYDEDEENYVLTFSTDEKVIRLTSKGNIELHADNDIIMTAENNVKIDAAKNILVTAKEENITVEATKKDIKIDARNDMKVEAGNNRDTQIGNNDTLTVGETWDISVEQDMKIDVSNDYTVQATDIIVDANGKMGQYAGSTWEQRAEGMKIDGGKSITVIGKTSKMSKS
jgi:uncharacterized protein involved in type VI secretion and phage assembly